MLLHSMHGTSDSKRNGNRVRAVCDVANEISHDWTWQTIPINIRHILQQFGKPLTKRTNMLLALTWIAECEALRTCLFFRSNRSGHVHHHSAAPFCCCICLIQANVSVSCNQTISLCFVARGASL